MKRFMIATLIVLVMIVIGGVVSVLRVGGDTFGEKLEQPICSGDNDLLRLTVPEGITRIDFWNLELGMIMQVDDGDTIEEFCKLLRSVAGTEGDPEVDEIFFEQAVYLYHGDTMCADYHMKYNAICGYGGDVKTLIRLQLNNPVQEYINLLFEAPRRWPVRKIPE